MFDMGFVELLVIGVVALLVIGPERLPGVARKAGLYFGRLKRFVAHVKSDVEREFQTDELKRMVLDQQQELRNLRESVQKESGALTRQIENELPTQVTSMDVEQAVQEKQTDSAETAAPAKKLSSDS